MPPHTRALVAATAYAVVTETKVAGLYDHFAEQHLRLAAEAHGGHLQGYDGDRDVRFGGSLPEIKDAGNGAHFHLQIEGATVRGYNRASPCHFTAQVSGAIVQVYDYAESGWFAYGVNVA